ncbi:MAG: alpha/beta hydrolase [Flavobacteriaceae bacterium]
MVKKITHVYLMPGMAANPSIFEYIKLPEDIFKIHLLEWIIPTKNESIDSYAKRMNLKIKHENPVLIGVSFGGVLVQEMSKYIGFKKLIIISSIKSTHELPRRMRLAKMSKAYKLLPTQLVKNFEALAKYAFGEALKKRFELYRKYLSVSDKQYLDWAIKNMVCWEQDEALPNTIHIHGDSDPVFPIKNISNCVVVKGGTHIMIINKCKWFNENLPQLILN